MRFPKKLLIGIAILILAIIIFVYSLSNSKPYVGEYDSFDDHSVTFFLIDGMDQKAFQKLLTENKLPICDSLIQTGLYVENGIGSFPTMTGYAFYPFITGMDAVNSGIYGLRWFDKKRSEGNLRNYVGRTNIEMNDDITDDYKNVFELAQPYYTASINTYLNRGVAHSEKTGWYHVTSKYNNKGIMRFLASIPFLGKSLVYDHFKHEELVLQKSLLQLKANPKIHWLTFAGPDASVHLEGMTDTYDDLLIHIDSLIGSYIHTSLALNHSRYFFIITDHGLETVAQNSDITKTLMSKGLKIERGKSTELLTNKLDDPITELQELDGFFVINGNLGAYLYFKDHSTNEGWGNKLFEKDLRNYSSHDTFYDLIEVALSDPSVDLISYQVDSNRVGISSQDGEGMVTHVENGYAYECTGADPLEYFLAADTANIYREDSFWLNNFTDTNPYAVPRLYDLMIKNSTGDLLITSKEGYDLAHNYEFIAKNYKGGHGGLRGSMLRVPYIISGPGIKNSKIHVARAEDVGATALQVLGFLPDYPLDGKSLISH